MATTFNFTVLTTSGTNFDFGSTGTGPYNDFNFTESGYVPSAPYDFAFGEGFNIYSILKGTSNNFNSIFVHNNKLYIGSDTALNVVDLATNKLYDYYNQTHMGRAGESLDSDDIVDINVIG